MASGMRPSMVEYLDGFTLDAIQNYRDLGFPANLGGMLIIESDRGELATADIARVAEICSKAGAIEIAQASNRAESNLLHEARRLALPAMEGLGALLIDDIAVPRTKLRSEEHTSDLQSLMRTSYAVFCLKKKNKTIQHTMHTIYFT